VNDDIDSHKLKTGTTTVGILCSDGVVLAADKRATMGGFIANKETMKILQIDDHLALTIAGGVGDVQMIARFLSSEANLYRLDKGKPMAVKSAGTLLANVLNQNRYYPYYGQFILGGFDEKGRLFSLDAAGGIMEEKCVSTGSGSVTAYGYLENNFKEGKPVKDNLKIAAKAIATAMKRDAYSGEGVSLVTITKNGYKEFTKEEVAEILAE